MVLAKRVRHCSSRIRCDTASDRSARSEHHDARCEQKKRHVYLGVHLELLSCWHAVQVDQGTGHARRKRDIRRILKQTRRTRPQIFQVVRKVSEPTQCSLGAVNEGASGVAEAARANVVQA